MQNPFRTTSILAKPTPCTFRPTPAAPFRQHLITACCAKHCEFTICVLLGRHAVFFVMGWTHLITASSRPHCFFALEGYTATVLFFSLCC